MKFIDNLSSYVRRSMVAAGTFLIVFICCTACERDNTRELRPRVTPAVWVTDIVLPVDEIVAAEGDTFEVAGRGFGEKDIFQLVAGSGANKVYFLPMEVSGDGAVVTVPQGLPDGIYAAVVRRDNQEQKLGELSIRIRNVDVQEQLPDIAGMNVKGVVRDKNGNPLSGVAVSDGVEVVTTDAQGRYYMYSDKSWGRMFISLPAGYMPEIVMNIPQISRRFMATNLKVEQFDFTLRPVDNDRCVLVVSTDYHLARRNDDLVQFRDFVNDVNRLVLTEQRPVYVLSMGDLAWDMYWYTVPSFTLGDFVTEMKDVNTVAFHCIGNHDHDPYHAEEWAATQQWRDVVMPTYYSFNIGKSHFVCLDDIFYVNNGGAAGTVGDRSYLNYVSEDQLAWLKKDLALVEDKTAPLFVQMHAPMAYPNSSFGNTYYNETRAQELLACFEGFSQVHILSGHSHDNRNCQLTDAVMDHNTGAVCACWWWSDIYSGRHICKDGTPGGYAIYELDNNDLTWYYKGTGLSRDVQFRTYDMNKVWLNPDTYLDDRTISVDEVPITIRDWFSQQSYGQSFNQQRSDNCVYINCWNWDPAWKIEVVEQGHGALSVTRLWEYDPLHLITYTIPRLNKGSRPTFTANKMAHMFSVQASEPSTTLHITVTDRFGRVYTEEMKRPKNFNVYSE